MTKKPVNHRGPKGQTALGKKIAHEGTKKTAKPAAAKTAAMKMGEMMHSKVHKTHAMKEKRNKTAKYH